MNNEYPIKVPEFKFVLKEGLGPEFLPTKAHDDDTGFDVRCAEPNGVIVNPFELVKINLGFRCFAPKGWWCELVPRSSTFTKKDLHCLYGKIDETFENYWLLAARYIVPINVTKQLVIKFGDPIGQIIPVKRQEMLVSQISDEEFDRLCAERKGTRGTGGFGSSG